MSAKHLLAGVLLMTAVTAGAIHAQSTMPPTGSPLMRPIASPADGAPMNPALLPPLSAAIVDPNGMPQPVSPSAADWLNGGSCNGCQPTGRNGPIGSEVFVMTGPTIPGGSGVLPRFLNTGWMVEGDIRSLFFNTRQDAAWAIVLGLTYQYNNGSGRVAPFNFFDNPALPVTIRELHRFSFTFGGGRDWFLYGPAQNLVAGTNLRVGIDTGGRWGGERVNLNLVVRNPSLAENFLHHYSVYGGYYIGAHIDLEVPMGSWVWFSGFRAEWGINFSNVIPTQSGNLNDVNLLLNTGFRF